jgi:hypothetical protein
MLLSEGSYAPYSLVTNDANTNPSFGSTPTMSPTPLANEEDVFGVFQGSFIVNHPQTCDKRRLSVRGHFCSTMLCTHQPLLEGDREDREPGSSWRGNV